MPRPIPPRWCKGSRGGLAATDPGSPMKPGGSLFTLLLVCVLSGGAAQAAPGGACIFKAKCAACHVPNGDRVPSPEALSRKSRALVLASLESGRMRIQGDGLTAPERRAVTTF